MNKPTLKILFDANPIATSQKSGVGYYTFQLIEALAKNYPEEIEMVGHYFNFLNRKKPNLPLGPNIRYRSSKLLPGKVLSLLRRLGMQLPFELLIKTKGDLALFPNYVSLPTLQNIKKAIAIHDLCFEDHPEYLQEANRSFLKRFVPKSVKKTDIVITISESTRQAIQKHYHIDSDSFLLTPIPPADPQKKKMPKPSDLTVPKKYILFMSTLEPRKNYISLVRAYHLLSESVKDEYGLVLAGGYGWDYQEAVDEIKLLQEKGENIILTGYVSEAARTYLYQNASIFVMPSHYEGFGMPILEAMSYGVPVAISNIPVFHEVAADAAVYFDRLNPKDIAVKLTSILTDEKLQQNLKSRFAKQLSIYNWDKVANDVMLSFRKITG